MSNYPHKYELKPSKVETHPMYLSNPIVNDGIKKFVTYILAGTAISNSGNRRFSDFYALREKLIERWPGIYIPNIPPKKLIGNVDQKNIDYRTRLLNVFCYKLSKIRYLFEGDEVKAFQTVSTETAKAIEKMPTLSYGEMCTRYKDAFPSFNEEYDLILGRGKLLDFHSFLKKSLINLTNFKEIVADTVIKTDVELYNYVTMMKHFEDYEKYSLLEYAENNEKKLVFFNPKNSELCDKVMKLKITLNNPYQPLNDWLEEEQLDVEAVIQAMNSFIALNETYDKTCQKSDQLDAEIKNIMNGLKTFKGLLSFKSKESTIFDLENAKKETDSNIGYLHQIIKICCFNMENKIEEFKQEKMKNYYRYLRLFAEIQKENNWIFNDLWDSLDKDLNIQQQQIKSEES